MPVSQPKCYWKQKIFILTLYLRKASRLKHRQNHPKITIIEGDVLDQEKLNQAMAGQDIVYANIDGKMAEQAENIIHTMNKHQINVWFLLVQAVFTMNYRVNLDDGIIKC